MMLETIWSDEHLLYALSQHDETAVKHVYRTNWPSILNFVLLNNGTEADAKDLFQDGMLDLLEKIWKGNFVLTCQLKTFLYTICKYKWLNKLKRTSPLVDIEGYEAMDDSEWRMEEDDRKIPDMDQVALAMASMEEPCKSLLTGYYYERRSMEEIATRMSYKNAQVAKQQKFRCKEKLKQRLLKLTGN